MVQVSLLSRYLIVGVPPILFVMNVWWFGKIVIGLIKIFTKADEKEKEH